MKLKIVVTALVLSLALPAAAQFRTISEAYEVALSDIRLPQRSVGTIAYKKCAECTYETKRVNTSTVWEINGQSMAFEKFRSKTAAVDNRDRIAVTVLHHLETDRVKKVSVLIP